jgi:hypothetical protein
VVPGILREGEGCLEISEASIKASAGLPFLMTYSLLYRKRFCYASMAALSETCKRCLYNKVDQKGLFSPIEKLTTDAKRGTSGASIQNTVWSRWHVGGVNGILLDLLE